MTLWAKDEVGYQEIVASMASAVDEKDTYTAIHSLHVGNMARFICEKLGLEKEVELEIYLAAKLHDVGKIGIPDQILKKTGKLDEQEWKIMKQHTQIGAYILQQTKELKLLSQIVLYHHERWDGKGYYGLKKNEISLGARIVAICDSIDAMMSKRVYRNALSSEECKQEIIVNKGRMYDPQIAEIVLENWDELLEIGRI